MAVALSSSSSTAARDELYSHYKGKISLNSELNRQLVSYQADKETPVYRWFKYREGFTSRLVRYLLERVHAEPGMLLDPFAGSGSSLFASSALGWQSCGIEVLPVGIHAMQAREAAGRVDVESFCATADKLRNMDFALRCDMQYQIKHIPITRGAYPTDTECELIGYIAYCNKYIENEDVRRLALYASFCILEEISYTRKDGQYLRWDYRSGRSQGTRPFNKGRILTFSEAIRAKLEQIAWDISATSMQSGVLTTGQLLLDFEERSDDSRQVVKMPAPQVIEGSCLDVLPTVPDESIDCFLTSPPYANRYDYTRTYALELVYLGCSHEDVTSTARRKKLCRDMVY